MLPDFPFKFLKNPLRFLFLEAYDLISHDPYLLTKLGRFEVRILRWAIRHQVLTKELAAQIFEVVEMNQGFHPVHFELMQAAYGTEEKPEYVGQICSYLIRTQQFDTKFHHRQIIVHMFLLDLFHGKTAHHPAILFINFRFAFL